MRKDAAATVFPRLASGLSPRRSDAADGLGFPLSVKIGRSARGRTGRGRGASRALVGRESGRIAGDDTEATESRLAPGMDY